VGERKRQRKKEPHQHEKNDKFVIEYYLTYDDMGEIGQRRPMRNNKDKWNLKNRKEKWD
jgi:hypothetical protein